MKVAATPSIASRIALAFQSASSTTGTDFGYLVKTASRESNFDASAKARSSSATGLFQFIESTWLETVKTSGAKHGLGEYADDITRRPNGSYTVSDPARRREILDLRKDPEASSAMAGEFTRKNATYLEHKLGREPSDGELYAAHFLGAGGASRLIRMAENDPDRAADRVFPRQARANRSIFYDTSGSARSVSDVLNGLAAQHDNPSNFEYATVVAANKPVPTPVAKAQAIAAAAGVPLAGGGDNVQTVIASRYYRPDETPALSRALAASTPETSDPDAETAPVQRLAASTAVTSADGATGEGALANEERVVASTVAAFAPAETPLPPGPKPARPVVSDAPQPVADAAVAVALAEADAADAPATALAEEAVVALTPTREMSREPVVTAATTDIGAEQDVPFASGNASARISSAWHAAQASTPFQALFRTEETSADERIDNTFVTAFRAQPDALQAAVEAHANAASAVDAPPTSSEQSDVVVASAAPGAVSQPDGRPFDLTGFLKYQIFKEPEDLVPPA